jgi:phosphohistidine phosphatase
VRLFALRHGKAGDGFPDEVRELTERGRRNVADVIAQRDDELLNIGLLLHSPLVRARETAEIVLQHMHIDPRVEESSLIKPGSDVEDFANYLAEVNEDVLICTHNPFVADLVTYLSGKAVLMPTSSLAALEFDTPSRGNARLLWLENP